MVGWLKDSLSTGGELTGTEQELTDTVLESSVTAPLRASARPARVALVSRVVLASAITVPMKVVPVAQGRSNVPLCRQPSTKLTISYSCDHPPGRFGKPPRTIRPRETFTQPAQGVKFLASLVRDYTGGAPEASGIEVFHALFPCISLPCDHNLHRHRCRPVARRLRLCGRRCT